MTNIIIRNKLKFWWCSLAILNTRKKKFNLHDNILELKVHFEPKLFLIQWSDEEDWIKLMYKQYITYNFSMAIGLHVWYSWNITKQKKIEKIMQCPSIKSLPFWYGSEFFPKKRHYYAFIVQKCTQKKNWMKFHPKTFNGLRFNSCISISCTIKKFTQQFHSQP